MNSERLFLVPQLFRPDRIRRAVIGAFSGLYRHRHLIWSFVLRDLRARYRGSALGVAWSFIHPLALLGLYTLVFSTILQVRLTRAEGTEHFALFLFCGMLPWLAFQEGLSRASGVLLENAQLIKRAVFPSEVLPVFPSVAALVNQLVALGLFAVILGVVVRRPPGLALLLFPLVVLLQLLLTVGLSWVVASLTVFVRDVRQALGIILGFWLFMTPIIYPVSMVPESLRGLLGLNPMTPLVESYRAIFLRGEMPPVAGLSFLAVVSLVVFFLGFGLFRRLQRGVADFI